MTARAKDPLLLTGKIICIFMQVMMVIAAIALTAGAAGVAFYGPDIAKAAEMEPFPPGFPIYALVGVMLIGAVIVAMVFGFFDRLRQIIGTVGEGDPFQPANAQRLSQMAWLTVGAQLIALPAAGLAMQLSKFSDEASDLHVHVDGGFDVEGILLAIVLFILARVFRHGTALREDLEGTV